MEGTTEQDRAGAGEALVSVVVPTRDRADEARRCIASVLAGDHPHFEVVVVDQSAHVTRFADDDRVRVVPSPRVGKSAALNDGIAVARGSVLAFTDDDCTVSRDWLSSILSVFRSHPEVDLLFGRLDAMPHDRRATFVPVAEIESFQTTNQPRDSWPANAGACMAARASLFDAVGGFDEMIGPGARFPAAEEFDFTYRTLASGRTVARTPAVTAVHWGGRPYADGTAERLKLTYSFGEGAVVGKHLRLRDRRMLRPGARLMTQDARQVLRSMRHGRVTGSRLWLRKWQGLAAALRSDVDRERRTFRTAPTTTAHTSHTSTTRTVP